MNIDELKTDSELDESEDYLDAMSIAEEIEDEDVSFYAELCKDEVMDSCTRQFLMSLNDDTKSKSAEECYLKNVIKNNKPLADMAQRQVEYEHKWQK